MELLHGIFIQSIQGESAIAFISLQQSPPFQKAGNPFDNDV
jgi:hypothetical protein